MKRLSLPTLIAFILFVGLIFASTSTALAAPLLAAVRPNLDSSGDVGNNPWLVLDAYQRPVIAYTDTSGAALKLVYCDNPVCSSRTINVVDDTDTGNSAVLQLTSEGLPVISYQRAGGGLYIAFCGTPTCEPGTVTIKALDDRSGTVGGYRMDMVLDAGDRPITVYRRSGSGLGGMWVAYCEEADCDAVTLNLVASTGVTYTSMKLNSSGNPVIAYSASGARLITCSVPDCSSAGAPVLLYAGSDIRYISLELSAAGVPRAVFFDNSGGIRLVLCNVIACGSPDTVVFSGTGTSSYTSMVLNSSGHPVFTTANINTTTPSNSSLRMYRCTNATCSPVPSSSTLHNNIGVLSNSLQLDCANNPVVAYYNLTAGDLRLYADDASSCAASAVPGFRSTPATTDPLEFTGAAGGQRAAWH